MKTKIIYISGGENFDIADIHAAFDTVRAAIGLDSSVVLFGVPIDSESAFAKSEIAPTDAIIVPERPKEKQTKISVKKNKPTKENISKSHEVEIITEHESTPEIKTEQTKIIPILSVLGNLKATENVIIAPEENITKVSIINPPQTESEIIINTTVSDLDFENDEIPEIVVQKTLEELLEQMSPLTEDNAEYKTSDDDENLVDDKKINDAKLEKLANEFAAKQDDVGTVSKHESNGKIGKLKNILPFKKIRREDTGLMGDLFGWAGIAANDEDFAIPGFFTTTAKK